MRTPRTDSTRSHTARAETVAHRQARALKLGQAFTRSGRARMM